jgi:hypothetical protein
MRRTVLFACFAVLPLCTLDYSTVAQAGSLAPKALNPQPIPPGRLKSLNPQPIPPGRQQRRHVMKRRH